jgi:hypothetical protein
MPALVFSVMELGQITQALAGLAQATSKPDPRESKLAKDLLQFMRPPGRTASKSVCLPDSEWGVVARALSHRSECSEVGAPERRICAALRIRIHVVIEGDRYAR